MKQRSVGIAILLSIITCGIYGIYWLIMLNEAKMQRGIMVDSSASVLYLILSIFGLSIVSYALMQSELNKMLPPQ